MSLPAIVLPSPWVDQQQTVQAVPAANVMRCVVLEQYDRNVVCMSSRVDRALICLHDPF